MTHIFKIGDRVKIEPTVIEAISYTYKIERKYLQKIFSIRKLDWYNYNSQPINMLDDTRIWFFIFFNHELKLVLPDNIICKNK